MKKFCFLLAVPLIAGGTARAQELGDVLGNLGQLGTRGNSAFNQGLGQIASDWARDGIRGQDLADRINWLQQAGRTDPDSLKSFRDRDDVWRRDGHRWVRDRDRDRDRDVRDRDRDRDFRDRDRDRDRDFRDRDRDRESRDRDRDRDRDDHRRDRDRDDHRNHDSGLHRGSGDHDNQGLHRGQDRDRDRGRDRDDHARKDKDDHRRDRDRADHRHELGKHDQDHLARQHDHGQFAKRDDVSKHVGAMGKKDGAGSNHGSAAVSNHGSGAVSNHGSGAVSNHGSGHAAANNHPLPKSSPPKSSPLPKGGKKGR